MGLSPKRRIKQSSDCSTISNPLFVYVQIDPFTVNRTGESNLRDHAVRNFCILTFFGYCYILQDFSVLTYWNAMKT